MNRVRMAAVYAAICAFAATGSAQTPVFRAGVEVLELDVSVVDGRGQQITDLAAPEFSVSIDGRQRRVLTAEYVSFSQTSAPQPYRLADTTTDSSYSTNRAPSRGRLIVLAVDRDSIAFGEGAGVLQAGIQFLTRLRPDDQVAFIAVPPTEPMIDFTTNRDVIRAALTRAVGLGSRPRRALNIGVYEAIAIARRTDTRAEEGVMDRFCPAPTRTTRTGPDGRQTVELNRTAQDTCRTEVRAQALTIAAEVQQRTDASIRTIRSVLDALQRVGAPASFVWISDGLVTDGSGGNDLGDIGLLAAKTKATVNVLMVDSTAGAITETERSPSARQDRSMERQGLVNLALATRGAFYSVGANAAGAFQRIESELAGYYLVAVESSPGDHDGKRHPIDVKVRRRGANVRARQTFQVDASAGDRSLDLRERLLQTLRSPLPVAELPIRVATYAYQDGDTPQVKVLIAAEVQRPPDAPQSAANVAVGLVVFDANGRQVTSGVQQAQITPIEAPAGRLLEYATAIILEPGRYTMRLALVDEAGRRGSVSRDFSAFQMIDQPFAVGDLLLSDAREADAASSVHPVVEPRLTDGRLGAYLELYSSTPGFLDGVHVQIEVARSESDAALVSTPARLAPADAMPRTLAAAFVRVDTLQPDVYVARAVISRDDKTIGLLSRPFRITRVTPRERLVPALADLIESTPTFERGVVLTPQVLGYFLDSLDAVRPGLRPVVAQVRRGRLDRAARQAFERGDQMGAAFLRGLELLSAGNPAQAGVQFAAALSSLPDFPAAAFYLGVCYADVGRHEEAATMLRRALQMPSHLSAQYALLADELIRAGEPEQAVVILREAMAAWPQDDTLRRRLSFAHAVQGQLQQALAQIEPYLERHRDDRDSLLLALHAIYTAHASGQVLTTVDGDRERMTAYADAYARAGGPHAPAVGAWADAVLGR